MGVNTHTQKPIHGVLEMRYICVPVYTHSFPDDTVVKNPLANAGDARGLGPTPG